MIKPRSITLVCPNVKRIHFTIYNVSKRFTDEMTQTTFYNIKDSCYNSKWSKLMAVSFKKKITVNNIWYSGDRPLETGSTGCSGCGWSTGCGWGLGWCIPGRREGNLKVGWPGGEWKEGYWHPHFNNNVHIQSPIQKSIEPIHKCSSQIKNCRPTNNMYMYNTLISLET